MAVDVNDEERAVGPTGSPAHPAPSNAAPKVSTPSASHELMQESAHWLAGLSGVTRALGELLESQRLLIAAQARHLDMNVTDMRALRLLDIHGPLGHTELAHLLDIRPASVTSLVDRLVVMGVVERLPSKHDRRRILVQARPEALAASLRVWEPSIRAFDAISTELPPDQQRLVESYLSAVSAAMLSAAEQAVH